MHLYPDGAFECSFLYPLHAPPTNTHTQTHRVKKKDFSQTKYVQIGQAVSGSAVFLVLKICKEFLKLHLPLSSIKSACTISWFTVGFHWPPCSSTVYIWIYGRFSILYSSIKTSSSEILESFRCTGIFSLLELELHFSPIICLSLSLSLPCSISLSTPPPTLFPLT